MQTARIFRHGGSQAVRLLNFVLIPQRFMSGAMILAVTWCS